MCLSNYLSCEPGSLFSCLNPHRFFHSEILRLYFPMLEPWVAQSVLLPSCFSRFICMQMWEYLVHQLLPCCKSSHPAFLSSPLLPDCMNVSLTPWLSGLHAVLFSVSSGCFFVFKFVVLLLVVRGGTVCLPTPPSSVSSYRWQRSLLKSL